MEKINWFPGHMKKALDMMKSEVSKVDVLIYVLDGRAPLACLNPEFVKIINEKPILFVLNKIDMSDEEKLSEVEKSLLGENRKVIRLNSTASGAQKKVLEKLKQLCLPLLERFKKKGISGFIRAMVIGVPNCGKSTLVNNLCGAYKAQTGNKPGVTKTKQWVKLPGNFELLDTPGTLWPNLSDQKAGMFLAFIGSIKDEVVAVEELSLMLIERLVSDYPKLFEERFGKASGTGLEILEFIATSRKFLLKGNEIDYTRAARAVLDDFRKGRIGKITLI